MYVACRSTKGVGANTKTTVHLTDLGSGAASETERQAPYSSVGQVRP